MNNNREISIDRDFIEEWENKADSFKEYEKIYNTILQMVREDLSHQDTININTFRILYEWLKDRPFQINPKDYSEYKTRMKYLLNINYKAENIEKKDQSSILDFIGLPRINLEITSTVLHFVFPNFFPIYNYGINCLLYKLKYNEHDHWMPDAATYVQYRSAFLKIFKECGGIIRLSRIFNALFAYERSTDSKVPQKRDIARIIKTPKDIFNNLLKSFPEIKLLSILDLNGNLLEIKVQNDDSSEMGDDMLDLKSLIVSSALVQLSTQKVIQLLSFKDLDEIIIKGDLGYISLHTIDSDRSLLTIMFGDFRIRAILAELRRSRRKLSLISHVIPKQKISLKERLQKIEDEFVKFKIFFENHIL